MKGFTPTLKLRSRIIGPLLAALLALAALLPSTALAAVGDCETWDGATYHSTASTDLLGSTSGSVTLGGNATEFAIRFKALGSHPWFAGWEYNGAYSGSVSFYLLRWTGNASNWTNDGVAYAEGVSLAAGTHIIYPVSPGSSGVALTQDQEYIAVMFIPAWNTIYYKAPINYPNTLTNMSATSGSAWYYHVGGGWGSWTNANPSAPNSWTLSPTICQDV